MQLDLEGRTIVVTGGTGSLGTSVVEELINEGARCAVPCYSSKDLDKFPFKDDDRIYLENNIDMTDETQTNEFYDRVFEQVGPIWASIHTAGGFGMGSIEETTLEKFQKIMQMNMVTCFNSSRAAVEQMLKTNPSAGRIVNVSARPALEPRQGSKLTAYTASKAAVAAFTESLAAEVISESILVNAVAPNVIDTPANREAMPDADYIKWAKPLDITRQILYLASPRNRATRGAVIPVYGRG